MTILCSIAPQQTEQIAHDNDYENDHENDEALTCPAESFFVDCPHANPRNTEESNITRHVIKEWQGRQGQSSSRL